jgi:hypothetical protein
MYLMKRPNNFCLTASVFIILTSAFLIVFGCKENKFSGGTQGGSSENVVGEPQDPLALNINCKESPTNADIQNTLNTEEGMQYFINAELCPKGIGSLSVLLVIDYSQSMQFPENLVDVYGPGKDPIVDNTCGRLKATAAIFQNIKDHSISTDQIDISVIKFSDDLMDDEMLKNIPLDEFESHLTKDFFCGGDGLTNYGAALNGAHDLLKDNNNRKLVYFVTDGKPYIPKLDEDGNKIWTTIKDANGNDVPTTVKDVEKAKKDASDAMLKIRNDIQELTFYAIYLKDPKKDEAEALTYLKDLAEDEKYNNVRIVSAAKELPTEITKFPIPGLEIDPSTVKAFLTSKKGGTEDLLIEKTEKSIDGTKTTFTTTSFIQVNKEDNSDHALFKLEAKTLSGIPQSISAQIIFGEIAPDSSEQ